MPDFNMSQSANTVATLLGSLLESKGPLAAWPSSAEVDYDGFEVVTRAFGRLIYSGMPMYHAIALVEKARAQQYKAVEIVQVTEAVRKLLLLDIPTAHVCGIVGCLFRGSATVPIHEATAFLNAFREKVMQGVESDRVYLEMNSIRARY